MTWLRYSFPRSVVKNAVGLELDPNSVESVQ